MSKTSASLLERLADREDSGAWRRLDAIYAPLIRGWLGRQGVPAHDLDDLTQDVLGVVLRELPDFRHNGRPGAFRAWLRAIATNCLRRAWRDRRRHAGWVDLGPLLDQLEDPASGPSRHWDREHDRHVLDRLLEAIEPEFRPASWAAFRRLALEGAPAREVADELGMSANAALIARSRILRRLREMSAGLLD